jgi:hypothetical protein
VRIQSAQIVDSDVVLELFAGLAALFEEVGTEPYLFEVGFMWIFCEDLFDCHFSLRGSMNPEPNQAEPASSEQPYPFEIFRKSISKLVVLISSQIGPNIESGFFSIFLVDFDGFFFLVFALAGGCAFLYAFGVLFLLPIK